MQCCVVAAAARRTIDSPRGQGIEAIRSDCHSWESPLALAVIFSRHAGVGHVCVVSLRSTLRCTPVPLGHHHWYIYLLIIRERNSLRKGFSYSHGILWERDHLVQGDSTQCFVSEMAQRCMRRNSVRRSDGRGDSRSASRCYSSGGLRKPQGEA
jgi:hypothetical protein